MPYTDPSRKLARARAYYYEHQAEKCADSMAHYQAHRDEISTRRRTRRAELRAGVVDRRTLRRLATPRPRGYYDRAWRSRNIEISLQRGRAWRAAHKDLFAHYESRRRARIAGASGSHTIKEWLEKLGLFAYCCAYCGRSDRPLVREHRIPLTRGGSNDIRNIVPACRPCNSSKHTKTDVEFIAARMAA